MNSFSMKRIPENLENVFPKIIFREINEYLTTISVCLLFRPSRSHRWPEALKKILQFSLHCFSAKNVTVTADTIRLVGRGEIGLSIPHRKRIHSMTLGRTPRLLLPVWS